MVLASLLVIPSRAIAAEIRCKQQKMQTLELTEGSNGSVSRDFGENSLIDPENFIIVYDPLMKSGSVNGNAMNFDGNNHSIILSKNGVNSLSVGGELYIINNVIKRIVRISGHSFKTIGSGVSASALELNCIFIK
ncbi:MULTISPECIES: hypothetical protein [unclassified Azospirillum]|uniref:hypothetical protein n=1 Tax=unclassified Azospirillum TaxID=2630922 RepID=UPI001177C706|nr:MULTISPECIES: hypothetical protein [unclassified Azospirillum]